MYLCKVVGWGVDLINELLRKSRGGVFLNLLKNWTQTIPFLNKNTELQLTIK